MKRKHAKKRKPSFGRRLRDLLISWGPVLLMVGLIRSGVAESFMVSSGSMRETIKVGDAMLVNKFAYGVRTPFTGTKLIPVGAPKRNDIVVFRSTTEPDLRRGRAGSQVTGSRFADDSRFWGRRPVSSIKGKPLVVHFSYESPPEAYTDGPETELKNPNIIQILLRPWGVRPGRIGHLLS